MLRKETAQAILNKKNSGFSKIVSVNKATRSRSSHDVYFLDYFNNGALKRLVFKGVPEEKRRTPKNYNLEKEARTLQTINRCNEEPKYSVPQMVFMDLSKSVYPEDYFLMEPIHGETISDFFKKASPRNEKLQWTHEVAAICSWVHSLDLSNFYFMEKIDYGSVFLGKFNDIVDKIEPYFTRYKPKREWELMRTVQKRLNLEKPAECDFALINGDISTGHFVRKKRGWCVLDWDSSAIGDKSWDLYWALKGVPEWVLGLDDGVDRLTDFYEQTSKKKLINSAYYENGAVAMAYVYGVHILENDLYHPHRNVIPELTGRMVKQLEKYAY
ncbi:hypothetical protein ES703_80285 [subsurface metagenome]